MTSPRLRFKPWLALTLAGAFAVSFVVCLVQARTMAHLLAAWSLPSYLALCCLPAIRCLPNCKNTAVRRGTAAIACAGFVWIVVFHLWHYASAHYVFINDDTLYYTQQLSFSDVLCQGLYTSLRQLAASMSTDYTNIPNLILALPFSLTDRSLQAHGLCGVVISWLPLMLQLRLIALRLSDGLKLSSAQTLLAHAFLVLVCCTLPVVHRATSWGQVNLLGVPVFVSIVILSCRTDFHSPHPLQLTVLFLCVVLLALLRRWFLFLLGGYLLCWGIRTICQHLSAHDFIALRHLLLYGSGCLIAGALLLWPMLRHAIEGNYAVSYSYWKGGGPDFWLRNQSWRAGWGTLIASCLGCLWGLLQRKSRSLRGMTGLIAGSALIAFVAFNSIQSMNAHQETILLPFFVFGVWLLFVMALSRIHAVAGRCLCTTALCALLLTQYGLCLTHEAANVIHPLLPYDTLKPPVRDDFAAIHAVADFIDRHCTAQDKALILCNSDRYDKQTFTNVRFPDLSIRDKVVQQGHSRPSDGFPGAWFTARYLVVPTVPQTNQPGGTSEKLTLYILEKHPEKFRTVEAIPCSGFELLILERAEPFTEAEVAELTDLFATEDAQYPRYYSQRIQWYYEQWFYNGQ